MAFQLIGCGDNAEDKPEETDAPVRQEAIYDFLRYCYDYDTQRSAATGNVRKDVMRTTI